MTELPAFDLLREPWIPCERDDSVVHLGIEETLCDAHNIRAVHDSSPLVTATLHRLLLAILQRALWPCSLDEWTALWRAPRFDRKRLRAYFGGLPHRFDIFDADQPFLQVARLRETLTAESKPPTVTRAARLAPERSFHSSAVHLFNAIEETTTIAPAQAARALLAFQGYTSGGRVQNDATSRKSGPLRGAAVALLVAATLKQTLLLNLPCDATYTDDLPPWERTEPPQRTATTRAPRGNVDVLVWCSRRVQLCPTRDAAGELVVRDVITAAGEDMSALCRSCGFCGPGVKDPKKGELCPKCSSSMDVQPPDPMVAYVTRDDPTPIAVRIDPVRATWRDAAAVFDPATGVADFRRPLACSQLAELVNAGVVPHTTPLHVELLGLASNKAAIRDWRHDRFPFPLSLLVSTARVELLRGALDEAENVADAIRQRVLFALGYALIGSNKDDIVALRDTLGTLPAYWQALGRAFPAWLAELGTVPAENLDASRWEWRGLVRQAAGDVVLRAIEDVGLTGPAMRASAAAERALALALAELLPLPEGASPERLTLPTHDPPVWTDTTGFLPAIAALIQKKDLGALAALRQSLQMPDGIAPEAKPYIEPLVPSGAGRRVRDLYYLVGALRALHRDETKGISLGDAFRRTCEARRESLGAGSTSARFEAIIAAHADDVGELVTDALPMLYDHGAIDWDRLFYDLRFWSRRDRLPQRALVRDFYNSPSPTAEVP